jgi:transcriptional regulator with XRE-family HTH domain
MTAETEAPPGSDPTKSILAFFGQEMKNEREDAGLSQAETARRTLTTQAMISYVEGGKRVPSLDLAEQLDVCFGTKGRFTRLHPVVLAYAYPSWFLPYVDMECEACTIRMSSSHLVSGLLQTEEYARAVLGIFRPDNLEELVAARMTRQEIFNKEDRPHAWFVLDERALTRPVASLGVRIKQLEHLLRSGEHPRTVIQVVPESVGAHPGLAGDFTLLSFPEEKDAKDVVYADGFPRGMMTPDPKDVARASHAYDLLRAVALSPAASAELISARLEDLKNDQRKQNPLRLA